jgi:hypothetical protein
MSQNDRSPEYLNGLTGYLRDYPEEFETIGKLANVAVRKGFQFVQSFNGTLSVQKNEAPDQAGWAEYGDIEFNSALAGFYIDGDGKQHFYVNSDHAERYAREKFMSGSISRKELRALVGITHFLQNSSYKEVMVFGCISAYAGNQDERALGIDVLHLRNLNDLIQTDGWPGFKPIEKKMFDEFTHAVLTTPENN